MSQKYRHHVIAIALAAAFLVGCDSSPGPGEITPIVSPDAGTSGGDGTSGDCTGDDCPERCPGSKHLFRLPDSDICVACIDNEHCMTGVCHPKTYQCVACYSDEHCPQGVCHPERNLCVECIANDDCESGKCDLNKQVCVGCGLDEECDDDNECTKDSCINKACRNVAQDGASCDGGPCTEPGVCKQAECYAKAIECPCSSDSECALTKGLESQCAIPYCADNGVCRVEKLPPETVCETANKCAEFRCDAGQCVMTSKVKICIDDNQCTTDSCDPEVGCVYKVGVVDCDDGDACTIDDTCKGGACVGQPTKVCDDGDPCTDNDLCKAGECAGQKTVCNDKNPCTDDYCDEQKGCIYKPNSNDCKGKNPCYPDWQCKDAECVPVSKLDCDDGNACTKDYCDSKVGCVHANVTSPCDDGDLCTFDDTCSNGECKGSEFTCEVGKPQDLIEPKDGCADTCVCPTAVQCQQGYVLVDSNKDGCKDSCIPTCKNQCECYKKAGTEFTVACLGGAENSSESVGPVWACQKNVCVEECGSPTEVLTLCGYIATKECKTDLNCAKDQFCSNPMGKCGTVKGKCETVPTLCTKEYEPVCGCDGQSYDNACKAKQKGQNVAAEGLCGTTCGGKENLVCADGLICDKPAGACKSDSVEGECLVPPASCPDTYEPVCGCDGKTYDNNCERLLANVVKFSDGKCGCTPIQCKEGTKPTDTSADGCNDTCVPCAPILCGTDFNATDTDDDGCEDACEPALCAANSDCGASQYCAFSVGVCGKGQGQCKTIPESCTDSQSSPLCGCDGKNYESECEAALNGVSAQTKGNCVVVCSKQDEAEKCGSGMCDFPVGTCGTDQQKELAGICVNVVEGQCLSDVAKPVCGCDGKTYKSECDRIEAKVSKDYDGKCGCKQSITCLPGYDSVDKDNDGCVDTCKPSQCQNHADCGDDGMYCGKPVGECDAVGTCTSIKSTGFCKSQGDYVCGCDGKTYEGHCDAHKAGVNIAAKGKCQASCGGDFGACPTESQFCELPTGVCSAKVVGECVDIPASCKKASGKPVCGCNGKTYINDCHRLQDSVAKSYDGACKCKSSKHCGEGWYCQKKACSTVGLCLPKPDNCPDTNGSVCGCNGKMYKSACIAAQQGESVDVDNTCTKPSGPSGEDSQG